MHPVEMISTEIGDAFSSVSDSHWRSAIQIRTFEQSLLRLFSEGKIFGTVHTCIGQEFSGVTIAEALQPGDLIYSNHRCHGHYLARSGDVNGLMAEIMGRQSGICGGRGGSQHICAHGVFSNGIQGGIVPVSTGLALAQKLQATGNVAVVFIGDGTLGEGIVYESMNIASKWELPLVIVLENNLYAQSTPQIQNIAGEILRRPEAFGIQSYEASIWNLDNLFATAQDAVAYARTNSKPAFLKIDTYRLMAHSKGDDDRSVEEVQSYWAIDPITRLKEADLDRYTRLVTSVEAEVNEAIALGELSPFTSYDAEESPAFEPILWTPTDLPESGERVVARIYSALREAMTEDERIVCIGEDIEGPYGGAFKVTKDLSLLFPGRVRNTPISEGAIVGISNGLAIAGMRPVCEIMFGDFMTLAFDQVLNHASKFRDMYNGQVSVALILRTAMGGKRGYGATHSQSIEKHFLGIPEVSVLAIHHRYDPAAFYGQLLRQVSSPAIVIENKLLYGQYVANVAPVGFTWEHDQATYPTTRLTTGGDADVTILCYGGVLHEVERVVDRLVDEFEIIPEVIVPMSIFPLDLRPILSSVRKTGRLLIVEEGQGFCAFGAEVIAQIVEAMPNTLKSIRRLSAAPRAIPSCKPAEDLLLPNSESIIRSVREVVHAL
jgi:2-oxoisovalerate dehydrogenase E1 component